MQSQGMHLRKAARIILVGAPGVGKGESLDELCHARQQTNRS